MNDMKKLKHYIDFLKREHNLSISLNVDDDESVTQEQLSKLLAPLRDILEIPHPEDNEASDTVKEVQKYLRENRSRNISSDDVCKALACSRSHVSHQFKAQTGISIREYLTKIRMEDAKHLLEFSDLNITEIAFATGFGSSNYFTNVFKKETGMSPSTYRKAKRENH